MKPIWIALLLAISPNAHATLVHVGSSSIEVPTPPGFARVVPEMTAVGILYSNFLAPTNEQLTAYIAEEDVPKALAGELPLLARRINAQVAKTMVNRPVTLAEFAELKKQLKAGFEQDIEDARATLPALMSSASKGVSERLGVELKIEPGAVVSLPAHYEDELSLASSIVTKSSFAAGDQVSGSYVTVTTATFLLVGQVRRAQ